MFPRYYAGLWIKKVHRCNRISITQRTTKPPVNLINLLIKAREAEIYKEKEEIVETLSKII
jgi:hypothetical protein